MTGQQVVRPTRSEGQAAVVLAAVAVAVAFLLWVLQDDWARTLAVGIVFTLFGAAAVVVVLIGFALAASRAEEAAEAFPDLQPEEVGKDGLQLAGADLTGVRLRGANLTRADLAGAQLIQADLTGATLERALLAGARLDEARLGGAQMFYADLEAARLDRADLSEADLTGANLTGARLGGAVLRGARLTNVRLSGADLRKADLRAAVVGGPSPKDVDARGARLDEATAKWLGAPPPSPGEDTDPQALRRWTTRFRRYR